MEFLLKVAVFFIMRALGWMIVVYCLTTATFSMVGSGDLVHTSYWDWAFWISFFYGLVRLVFQMRKEYRQAYAEIYWD